jgi:hypothetical protein
MSQIIKFINSYVKDELSFEPGQHLHNQTAFLG